MPSLSRHRKQPTANSTRSEAMKTAQVQIEEQFKILRAADPAVVGGTQPLQIAKEVHFHNAQGGLRLVNAGEVRDLARFSARNLLKALGKA
jgi:hypothetical protein